MRSLQGGVYEVKDKAGNVDMSQVLKVSYSAALLSNIKREWEIGRRLNSLAEPQHALNGYMGTGAGIQKENGKFLGEQPSPATAHSQYMHCSIHVQALHCRHCASQWGTDPESREALL